MVRTLAILVLFTAQTVETVISLSLVQVLARTHKFCVPGNSCDVECSGSSSCNYNFPITCPANVRCDLTCSGSSLCYNIAVTNNHCDIVCSGSSSCYSLNYHCPTNENCNINCSGQSSCWISQFR